MIKRCKKMISLLLVICFVFSSINITALADTGTVASTKDEIFSNAIVLSDGIEVEDSFEAANECAYYSFTPESDGEYQIRWTASGEESMTMNIYKGTQLWQTRTRAQEGIIHPSFTLTSDNIYYFEISNGNNPVSYSIKIIKQSPAETITINGPKEISAYPGTYSYLSYEILPEGYIYEPVEWSSSNPSVVKVSGTFVQFRTPGEATIKVTTMDTKLEDQIHVTVLEPEEIKLNEMVSRPVSGTEEVFYRFTPPKDGQYKFSKSNMHFTLQDSNCERIYGTEDFIFNLKGGEEYYINVYYFYENAKEYSLQILQHNEILDLELVSYPKSYYHDFESPFDTDELVLNATLNDGTTIKWTPADGEYIAGNKVEYSTSNDDCMFINEHYEMTITILCGGQEVSYNTRLVTNPNDTELKRYQKILDVMNSYMQPSYHYVSNDPLELMSVAEYKEIKNKAIEVTKNCVSDYEKIEAIAKYISNTIYYDYAWYLDNIGQVYTWPTDVYKYKRTVCDGYARLTDVMLYAVGISSTRLLGEDHAFNVAYDSDNDRWLIIDTTWCSQNEYRIINGKAVWESGEYNDWFFDATPWMMYMFGNHEVFELDGLTDDNKMLIYCLDCTGEMNEWTLYARTIDENYVVKDSLVFLPYAYDKMPISYERFYFQASDTQRKNIKYLDMSQVDINIVGYGAFQNSTKLSTVAFSNATTGIGASSFKGCTSLTSVELPKNLESIWDSAFANCTSLKKIYIPKSVTEIADNAFDGCKNLTIVCYKNSYAHTYAKTHNIKVEFMTSYILHQHQYKFTKADGEVDVYKCSSCEATMNKVHEYSKKGSIEATCTEGAYDRMVCTACGTEKKVYTSESIPHTTEVVDVKEATCMKEGYTGDEVCIHCDALVEKGVVIPTTHQVPETEVITVEKGAIDVRYYQCKKCGQSIEEIVQGYRLSGATRFDTSLVIADALKEELGVKQFDTVIIASGMEFADALSGSYLAAVKNAPILLSDGKNVVDLQTYIKENLKQGGTIYVLGGTKALPKSVTSGLKGYNIERLGGSDRFETNLLILKEAGIAAGEDILVATGTNFADSLSASATGLPILLVDPKSEKLTDAQIDFLDDAKREIYIIGGSGAVSETYEAEFKAYDADGTVKRIYGTDRYATSVEVAKTFGKNPDTVVIASAVAFPDGLCGGPLAYSLHAPLILTADGGEVEATKYVSSKAIRAGVVLGGTYAVSDCAVIKILREVVPAKHK